jgi:hypothetical protein
LSDIDLKERKVSSVFERNNSNLNFKSEREGAATRMAAENDPSFDFQENDALNNQ